MHIVINQSNNVFGIDAENKIFAKSTETITFDVTFNDPQATLQGLYCALLSDGGKTLALTTISENKAVLDTNTTDCVEYVAQWAIGTTRHAFLVVGESTKPLAIIDVEVSQNPLEGLMPPTESAPSYPTSAELQAILAEVKAQAQSASKSAQSANQDAIFVNTAKTEVVRIGAQITTDRVLISGYASTASSGASRAEEAKRIAVNASEIVSEMQDEIGATKTKIDATAKVVQANADAVAGAKKEIDTAISTANTAINEAVGKAETAKGDAVKAQGEASKSAEQASTSASNASKSATASATSASQAKTTADALNAGLATLNGFDGRVGTLETTVQPTMAGGLLDVQVGHNAMVKVCKVTKANRKIIAEIVKPFGYSVDVENGGKDIYVAGVGNFWFINVSCASNVAFVCDSKLNYKFAIDGNNPNWATGSVFDGNYGYFNGNGIAVNTENSRIYNAYTEYRQTTNGTKMAIFLQSWCAKTEYLKDENGKVVKDEQGKDTVLHVAGEKLASVKIDDALIEETYIKSNVSLAYLPNAKMLCVGCKILVDAETLAYVGEVMDATSQAGDEAVEKARQTAYYCLAKTSGGSSATFDKQRWAVYYGSGIRPCYIDDITDPTKPTLRNFKNASGAEVTQAYRAYACAELDNSWDNHSSYFLRSADNKLAWCKVAWTKPEKSSSGTLEAVIGSETITESNVKDIATVIPSQGFFGAPKNSNQVVALLAFGGAIVQQISIQSPIATPAIDTMVDQGVNKLNKSAHWMSRQTDYGYIIPQSGSRNQKSAISVILNRPMV